MTTFNFNNHSLVLIFIGLIALMYVKAYIDDNKNIMKLNIVLVNILIRLFSKGFVTTILGLIVIGFSAYMSHKGKFSNEELTGWLGLGILLLRSKDSLIGIKGREDEEEKDDT